MDSETTSVSRQILWHWNTQVSPQEQVLPSCGCAVPACHHEAVRAERGFVGVSDVDTLNYAVFFQSHINQYQCHQKSLPTGWL